jgi:hypothetical protein
MKKFHTGAMHARLYTLRGVALRGDSRDGWASCGSGMTVAWFMGAEHGFGANPREFDA